MPVSLTALISLFLLGVIPTLVKLTQAGPVEIGLARVVVATIVFYAFVRVRRKTIRFTRTNFLPCAVIGLSFGIHWALYFWSIKIAGVVVAALGLATYGLFMILFGKLFFDEKITGRDLVALGLALIGCFLILPSWEWGDQAGLGLTLGLLNAFFFSLAASLQKKYAREIPIETRTFSQYLFALPVFLVLWPKTKWHLETSDWFILFALGLFCTAVAHSLWILTLEKIPAKTSGVIYYLSTFFAILTGAIVLGDVPSLKQVMGGFLIVGASAIAMLWRMRAPTPVTEPG